jgi:hypothetical protein
VGKHSYKSEQDAHKLEKPIPPPDPPDPPDPQEKGDGMRGA